MQVGELEEIGWKLLDEVASEIECVQIFQEGDGRWNGGNLVDVDLQLLQVGESLQQLLWDGGEGVGGKIQHLEVRIAFHDGGTNKGKI